MSAEPKRDWGSKPIIVLIGTLASLIAIVTFMTGRQSLPELLNSPRSTSNDGSRYSTPSSARSNPSGNSQPITITRPTSTPKPSINLTGTWAGTLRQIMPNATQTVYNFTMMLTQRDSIIAGGSRLDLPAYRYYAVFTLAGSINSRGEFTFGETGLTSSYPAQGANGFFWCAKQGRLLLTGNGTQLSGAWSSPGCPGGLITLTRQR